MTNLNLRNAIERVLEHLDIADVDVVFCEDANGGLVQLSSPISEALQYLSDVFYDEEDEWIEIVEEN